MQKSSKKIKATITLCILSILALIVISIALIININLSKKEIYNQQKQLKELQQQIEFYKNPPSDNNQTIIPGGNEW